MCDFMVYTGKDDTTGRCVSLGAKVVGSLAEPLKRKGTALYLMIISLLIYLNFSMMGSVVLQQHKQMATGIEVTRP